MKGKYVSQGVENMPTLKAVDLRRHISLGIEHMLNTLDERRGFLPFFGYQLTVQPVLLSHSKWDCPDTVGRYLDAIAKCRGIVDTPDESPEVSAMARLLHSSIGEDGLVWNKPTKLQRDEVVTHVFRTALLGLTELGRWRDCDKSKKLARKLCLGLERVTRETGGFPGVYYTEKGWEQPADHWYGPPGDSGRLIGALVDYFRLTHDALAIELAIRFTKYNLSNAFDENGNITKAAGPHVHSITGTVAGMADLGLFINDRSLIETAKRIYDVGLAPLRSRSGWVKAGTSRDNSDRGEANNTGDLIEAALLFGKAGFTEYFEDAERMVRNHLIASQLEDVSWIQETQDKEDTSEVIYGDVARRAKGGFAFCAPNDFLDLKNSPPGGEINADLVSGGVRALCETWNSIVTEDEVGIRINLLLSCETNSVRIKSSVPNEGKLVITPFKDTNLLLKVPSWCDPSELKVTKDGATIPVTPQSAYLIIWNVRDSESIQVSFPLVKQTAKECINNKNYTIEWLGDTILSVSPQGTFRPLYGGR